MRFVTLYLKTENVHLLKDVGMIPYYMMKEHGAESTVVTYDNGGEYSYTDNEVRGLGLEFVRRSRFGRIVDGMLYLMRNAGRIDVLNIYHLNLSSYFYEIVYRMFNRRGVIYLKLDMNPAGFITCFKKNPVGMIKRATIRRADLASVETTAMRKKLRKFFGEKIIYIPNGCYRDTDTGTGSATADGTVREAFHKENVILTVGNLGTFDKATEVLLEAYKRYMERVGEDAYKLRLVGSIEDDFRKNIDEFFGTDDKLRDKVVFTGPVSDKRLLNEEYERARIFTLPSRSESFGIVLVEAALKGCYLVTSDMVPAGYDVSHRYENGVSVPAGDPEALCNAFTELTKRDMDWEGIAKKTAAYVKAAFDWSRIVGHLNDELNIVM